MSNLTYVFDMARGVVRLDMSMPEWSARYPVVGVSADAAYENGRICDAWRSGLRKLCSEEMPRTLVLNKTRKSWPDAFFAPNALMVVRQPAKAIIEKLDPGVHQFFPLIIQTKRGIEIPGPWFAMNVSEHRDAIVRTKGFGTRLISQDQLGISYEHKDVTVDPQKLSPDLNLWRDARVNMSLLGSDTLVAALKAAKLRFFKSFPAKNFDGEG